MELLNDQMDGARHKSRRRRAACIGEKDTVVTEKGGILKRREDATVGVDADEQQGGDALQTQDRVELIVPKAAQPVLEYSDVFRVDRQLLDNL